MFTFDSKPRSPSAHRSSRTRPAHPRKSPPIGAFDEPRRPPASVAHWNAAAADGDRQAQGQPIQARCACEGRTDCSTCAAQRMLDTRDVPEIDASQGTALPPALQADAEAAFQVNFNHVRVHDDGAAAQAARKIHAHAFTAGNHIYFGSDLYRPETRRGRELIGHELTHVLQQRRGLQAGDNTYERDADAMGRAFALRGSGRVGSVRDWHAAAECEADTARSTPVNEAARPVSVLQRRNGEAPIDRRWDETTERPSAAPLSYRESLENIRLPPLGSVPATARGEPLRLTPPSLLSPGGPGPTHDPHLLTPEEMRLQQDPCMDMLDRILDAMRIARDAVDAAHWRLENFTVSVLGSLGPVVRVDHDVYCSLRANFNIDEHTPNYGHIVSRISGRLGAIKRRMRAFRLASDVVCEPEESERCRSEEGRRYRGFAELGGAGPIHLCPSWRNNPDLGPKTILHEVAHLTGRGDSQYVQLVSMAGAWISSSGEMTTSEELTLPRGDCQRGVRFTIGPAQTEDNADSYAYFSMDFRP